MTAASHHLSVHFWFPEATSRIKINKLLESAGWRFVPDGKLLANIQLETSVTIKIADLDAFGNDLEKTANGFIDFLLLDSNIWTKKITPQFLTSVSNIAQTQRATVITVDGGREEN